ncbi:MAG: L,D-transpeptidase [Kiritimatiellia bacterium]
MKFLMTILLVSGTALAEMSPLPPPAVEEDTTPYQIVIEEVALPSQATQPVMTRESDPVVEDPDAETVEERAIRLPNCSHALLPPKGYSTEVLMLQIFLDRHNFSAGVIDGVWGTTSRTAMAAWQTSEGVAPTTWIDLPLYARIAEMVEPLERYAIVSNDVALVTGATPPTWAERSRLRVMGYDTLGECIAERFHTSERTLRYLNPAIINWPEDLTVGTSLVVPNVRMAALEHPARLVIALDECLLVGYDTNGVIRLRFPCSIARNKRNLPQVGEVTIKNMAIAPNYTYDPANYGQDESIGKMVVPAGPRNPVGSRWIGLSLPGYGIHGTPHPNTIGRPESRGCFRLTNWNVEKLFALVHSGMRVDIIQKLADVHSPANLIDLKEAKEVQDKQSIEGIK